MVVAVNLSRSGDESGSSGSLECWRWWWWSKVEVEREVEVEDGT